MPRRARGVVRLRLCIHLNATRPSRKERGCCTGFSRDGRVHLQRDTMNFGSTASPAGLGFREVALALATTVAVGLITGGLYREASRTAAGPLAADGLTVSNRTADIETILARDRPNALLIFVFSSSCEYCERNLRYWQSIISAVEAHGDEKAPEWFFAAFEPFQTANRYLADVGFPNPPLKRLSSALREELNLDLVPSTVVIPSHSQEFRTWRGLIRESDLVDILALAEVAPSNRR